MILWAIFIFVVIVMIISGVLLSQLAEISREDKERKVWIWGVIMIIAILVFLLVVLGIVVILVQYTELAGTVFRIGSL